MTSRLGPPLDLMLAAVPRRRGRSGRRSTGSGRSTPTTPSPRCRCSTAPPRPSPPYAATAAGSSSSPASSPPTPGCTSTTSGSTSTTSRARCGASARPTSLRREGVSIYVGDHVHDVEGALAAGATSVSVLTGGCTREELLDAGTHVVLDDLSTFPGLARRAPPRPSGSPRSRSDLRARGSVLVAFSGGADSAFLLAAAVRALGPDHVVAATGYSHSLPPAERDPAREFAESLGVERAHARDPRDGARGLPRQRRRPLLLLQGRAARRAHPARRRARPRPRRHRHQRRRRRGRLPARASARPPSAARSPRCATPG